MIHTFVFPNSASSMWLINQEAFTFLTRFESASYFYARNTSETHFLTAFHDELIEYLLSHSGATTMQLSLHIAEICEEGHSDEWLSKTDKALMDLSALGLIIKKASE